MLILLMSCSMLASCDTDDGSYTAPITLYEKVGGTWALTGMKQTDEVAKAKGEKVTETDLTGYFSTFVIRLDTDADNVPTSYEITGGAPALLPENGYWKLDREFQNWDGTPVTLSLYSDAACTQKTAGVQITAVPGSAATMDLTLTRKANSTAFVSYTYTLTPVNE